MILTIPLVPLNIQALPRSLRKRNEKFDGNVNKRGKVPAGKAADREVDGHKISNWLIALFVVLVVGSSLVSVLNLFGKAPAL